MKRKPPCSSNVVLYFLSLTIALSSTVLGQSLSGFYSIGGSSPDFATPQDAANALKRRGVSGPTFFNLRPGVYTRDGGTRPVMDLDSLVTGLTPANRITFQPDAAAGGNVDNTIFEIDFDDPSNGTSALVFVRLDYVTFRKLTFRDADSLQAGAVFLLRGEASSHNSTIDGLIVDNCRFEGNPFFQGSAQFGTDRGVFVTTSSANITVRNSSFTRLRRAVEISDPRVPIPGKVIVEDNEFTLSHFSFTGTGATVGTQINANGDTAIVRRNLLDLEGSNGGFFGITVGLRHTGIVEQNTVKNRQPHNLFDFRDFFQGITVTDVLSQDADSVLVANNMVSGTLARKSIGIVVHVPRAKVFHNTVVTTGPSAGTTGLIVHSPNGKVLNNIIQDYSPPSTNGLLLLFDFGLQGDSPGLVSDYNAVSRRVQNAFFAGIVIHNAVTYNTFAEWQATGQDTNTVVKEIDFIHVDRDVHLSDCQAQDPDLLGIPLAEVPFDIDGEARNTPPLRGADETARRSMPMFGDVFRIPVPGRLSDIAIGKFDNIIGDGIAIADVDSRLIRLFHNTASTRSFTPLASLNVLFRPLAIEFIDLDKDGKLDLVAGGDAGFLTVFWGDGLGGFPENTNVPIDALDPAMEVVAIDTGSVHFPGVQFHTVIFSSGPNNVLPPINFLNFIVNDNGRNLSIETASSVVVITPLEIKPDTLHGILKNLVGRDFDGDDEPEVAAILGSGVLTDLVVFEDETRFPFVHFSNHSDFDFGAHSYMPTSSLVAGHFGGGANPDLAVTNGAGDVVRLRNQGNLNFIADTISVNEARGLATMDYDGDGDLDIVTANHLLQTNGVTVLLNNLAGRFQSEFNCHAGFAFGVPKAIVASDFDIDGRTDIAVAGFGAASDTVFVLYNFGGGITTVADIRQAPERFSLSQNYPNPFNPSTTIRYQLLTNSEVSLTIYNMLGQRVKTLVQAKQPAGSYTVQWNGANDAGTPVASGVYFYRLRAGDFAGTRKLLLVR